jgi:hypothetical protein
VQLTHRHADYGELVRVLAGPHDERPADLPAEPDLWRGFYPLDAAVRQGLMTVVANAPVPPGREAFPLFKTGVRDYVYSDDEGTARRAASELEGEVSEAADGSGWLVKVRGRASEEVEAVADRHGAEYDASEVPVRTQGD